MANDTIDKVLILYACDETKTLEQRRERFQRLSNTVDRMIDVFDLAITLQEEGTNVKFQLTDYLRGQPVADGDKS